VEREVSRPEIPSRQPEARARARAPQDGESKPPRRRSLEKRRARDAERFGGPELARRVRTENRFPLFLDAL
jgi:hypothetical protein